MSQQGNDMATEEPIEGAMMDVQDMSLEEFVTSGPLAEKKRENKKLSRDQVSMIMNALRPLQPYERRYDMASKAEKAILLASLLKIMEVLGYEFEDNAAAGNALSEFWEFNELRGIH
jgi:hypothetical protein